MHATTAIILISSVAMAAGQSLADTYCGTTNSTDTSTFINRCNTAINTLTCATPVLNTDYHCTASTTAPGGGSTMCISCAGPVDIPAKVGGTSPKVYNPIVPAGVTVQVPATSKLSPACYLFDQACKVPCTVGSTATWSTQCDKNNGVTLATCTCGDGSHPDVAGFSVIPFVDPSKVATATPASATATPTAGSGTGAGQKGSNAAVGMKGMGTGVIIGAALAALAMI
ncbi:hypothetical protein HDV00_005255 [Rhizophlyctis rosea]|nr:hypothetical protein HDV00_005255 [Rhizophlyctis rosea]